MPQEPLSELEAAVQSLLAAHYHDPFLNLLADDADGGVPAVIGVVTGGFIVFGKLVGPEAVAEALDAQRTKLAARAAKPDGVPEDEMREVFELFSTAGARHIERHKTQERELEDEIKAHVAANGEDTPLPADVARRDIQLGGRSAITMIEVSICAPNSRPTRVPVLRLPLNTISGWWPVETDAAGQASFSPFND